MSRPNGYELYRGPSQYTGGDIVVIGTGFRSASGNSKTGDLIQTHIMGAGLSPADTIRARLDADMCLGCAHNFSTGRGSCYVAPIILRGHGTESVWHSWRRGIYPKAHGLLALASLGAGRGVRLGTWGDPAAVPVHVWKALISRASHHTGYTHAGGHNWERFAEYRSLCMASVETREQARHARGLGWRTYRTIPLGVDPVRDRGEAQCPASKEAQARTTCNACPLSISCRGASPGSRVPGVAIIAHGATAKRMQPGGAN